MLDTANPADLLLIQIMTGLRHRYESSLLGCFSSVLSSRLIAARMFMNPPVEIYLNRERGTRCTAALLAGAGYAFTVDELFELMG